MSGISDVRLRLKGQELNAEYKHSVTMPKRPGEGLLALYLRRWTNREQLLKLTMAQLRDAGIDPQYAREEGLKPFWRE